MVTLIRLKKEGDGYILFLICKGCEGRSCFEFGGEIADIGLHGGVPESVKTEEIHFPHGLFGGPSIERHAIGRNENARAIVTEAAMNEDFFLFVGEQAEKLRDLFVRRRGPTTDRNVYETHAEGFGLLALFFDEVAIFAAKIDDDGDAKFLELFDAFGMRLGAAKERVCDFSAVRKAGKFEPFAVGGAKHRSR